MFSPPTPSLVPSPAHYALTSGYAGYPYASIGTPPPRSTSAVSSTGGSTSSKSGTGDESKKKHQQQNVFSNDGRFLDRIKRTKMEEAKKEKDSEKLTARREFENRFKNRRKRPAESTDDLDSGSPAMKTRAEVEGSRGDESKKADNIESSSKSEVAYANEVLGYSGKGNLKDDGASIRSLVK